MTEQIVTQNITYAAHQGLICVIVKNCDATIIFKTIGTHSPEAYNLREIESPAPPFQCCVTIFILFQAPTDSAYNTTTLIEEGGGEGRDVTAKRH